MSGTIWLLTRVAGIGLRLMPVFIIIGVVIFLVMVSVVGSVFTSIGGA